MKMLHVATAGLAVALLGACSTLPPAARAERQLAATAAYTAAAGEPVQSFRFVHLVSGQRLGPHELIIRTWPTSVWMVSVDDGCDTVPIASGFGIRSWSRQVFVRTDRVLIFSSRRTQACRITQIRPIDLGELASEWREQGVQGDVIPLYPARG